MFWAATQFMIYKHIDITLFESDLKIEKKYNFARIKYKYYLFIEIIIVK